MHSLSASRLNDFLGCPHQAALWLAGIKPEGEVDATLQLIRDKGFEHEAAVLSQLEKLHGPAEVIPPDGSFSDRIRLTREAIERGAKLIYQGALSKEAWLGYPDFLLRTASAEAATIEPEDAKLSRKAKGEYLLQLGIYAELLESLFGIPVHNGAIHVAPATFSSGLCVASNVSLLTKLVQQSPGRVRRVNNATTSLAARVSGARPIAHISSRASVGRKS